MSLESSRLVADKSMNILDGCGKGTQLDLLGIFDGQRFGIIPTFSLSIFVSMHLEVKGAYRKSIIRQILLNKGHPTYRCIQSWAGMWRRLLSAGVHYESAAVLLSALWCLSVWSCHHHSSPEESGTPSTPVALLCWHHTDPKQASSPYPAWATLKTKSYREQNFKHTKPPFTFQSRHDFISKLLQLWHFAHVHRQTIMLCRKKMIFWVHPTLIQYTIQTVVCIIITIQIVNTNL